MSYLVFSNFKHIFTSVTINTKLTNFPRTYYSLLSKLDIFLVQNPTNVLISQIQSQTLLIPNLYWIMKYVWQNFGIKLQTIQKYQGLYGTYFLIMHSLEDHDVRYVRVFAPYAYRTCKPAIVSSNT